MQIWGYVHAATFGIVGLPTDEPPLEIPDCMKDDAYRETEREWLACMMLELNLI